MFRNHRFSICVKYDAGVGGESVGDALSIGITRTDTTRHGSSQERELSSNKHYVSIHSSATHQRHARLAHRRQGRRRGRRPLDGRQTPCTCLDGANATRGLDVRKLIPAFTRLTPRADRVSVHPAAPGHLVW
jgi:hypothetical protein